MGDKLKMSDEEYDRICKGIIGGVGIGTLIGAIIGNVCLFFALGGVIGIVISTIYNIYKRHIEKKMHNSNLD